jgi:hypothetical protein
MRERCTMSFDIPSLANLRPEETCPFSDASPFSDEGDLLLYHYILRSKQRYGANLASLYSHVGSINIVE